MSRSPLAPADFARQALEALEASEGRRRRRHRDTTPDRIGLDLKRRILEDIALHGPAADEIEVHLFEVIRASADPGATRAMCIDVLDDYRAALSSPSFRGWLERGAPSEDRSPA
jgi:hypothetical protein